MFKSQLIEYGPSKGVVLLGFSVVCFWRQRFCDVSFYLCSYCLSLVWFAELRPLLGRAVHSIDHIYVRLVLTKVISCASVPGFGILFTFGLLLV